MSPTQIHDFVNSLRARTRAGLGFALLFADLKGSMELLADRDPEEARKLLDPVLELCLRLFLPWKSFKPQKAQIGHSL